MYIHTRESELSLTGFQLQTRGGGDFRGTVLDIGFTLPQLIIVTQISRDELVQKLSTLPTPISRETKLVEDFISSSHRITMALLSRLAQALDLPHLRDSHCENVPSDCGLKLESVPLEERLEDVPPSEHTDSGSLTLLFCPQYTTEIWVPERKAWEFIVPKAGYSIVNVADSLQALSEGALLSSLHRVGQPVAGGGKRFCLLYYLRPGVRG